MKSQPLLVGTKHAPPPIVKPEDVQISKGVPYPARRARITPKWEPLLKSMAVGDCIKFDTERDSKVVMGACSAMRKRDPECKKWAFRSAKSTDDKGKVFYGVWRAA